MFWFGFFDAHISPFFFLMNDERITIPYEEKGI